METAVKDRASFFSRFNEYKSSCVDEYTSIHRHGDHLLGSDSENWLSESQRTAEIFPGRPLPRPGSDSRVSSNRENANACRKNDKKSDTHTPGIFLAQRVCSHPKNIGLAVMMEIEGMSSAFSILQSRFRNLPRGCCYDSACNMLRSIVLWVSWVNDEFLVVCDQFHYRGDTCG